MASHMLNTFHPGPNSYNMPEDSSLPFTAHNFKMLITSHPTLGYVCDMNNQLFRPIHYPNPTQPSIQNQGNRTTIIKYSPKIHNQHGNRPKKSLKPTESRDEKKNNQTQHSKYPVSILSPKLIIIVKPAQQQPINQPTNQSLLRCRYLPSDQQPTKNFHPTPLQNLSIITILSIAIPNERLTHFCTNP